MVRIAGVDLLSDKRVDIALSRIYGVGASNVRKILKTAKVEEGKRVKDLKEDEVARIQKIIDTSYRVEGDLRQEVAENIKRLKVIGCYRGIRHSKNLPVKGQRTRSNARTKRGKRVTIGALKKEVRAQMGTITTDKKAQAQTEVKEVRKK